MKIKLLLPLLLIKGLLTAQTFEWAKSHGGSGSDVAYYISTDAAGNSYVAGTFSGSITVNSQTFSESNGNVLLLKYNSSGSLEWTQQLKSIDVNQLFTRNNDLYIAGEVKSGGSIGSTAITGDANGNAFFSKLSAAGTVLMTKTGGGSGSDFFSGLTIDQSGNIYVTGGFDNIAVFDGVTFNGNGDGNFLVIKYSTLGVIEWSETAQKNGNFYMSGRKIEVTPLGNHIYILGNVGSEGTDTVKFDAVSYAPGEPGASFIVHYDVAGNAQKVLEVAAGIKVSPLDIELDNTGNVYLVINYSYSPYKIFKYDSQLNNIWTTTDGGEQIGIASIKITPSGDICVAGGFYGSAEFQTDTIVIGGVSNGFVAKYNAAGNFSWAINIGGGFNGINDISMDAAGNIYVAGSVAGTAYFNAITLTSNGAEDIMVAKLNPLIVSDVKENAARLYDIYPNPAQRMVNIAFTGNVPKTVNITTISGQLVYNSLTAENNLAIPLENFKAGIYFVEINDGEGVFNSKLVVKD